MKRKKILSIIIIFLIVILACILGFSCWLLINIQEDTEILEIKEEDKPITVQDILKKYETEYLREEENKIYVNFAKYLFNENGGSNENYFVRIVEELGVILENQDFYLIDESKKINIFAQCDENGIYRLIINDIENYFSKVDGYSYAKVESSEIAPSTFLEINNSYLNYLLIYDSYFSSIEEKIGEGVDLENGYKSYEDGKILIRTVPTGAVKNMIFKQGYDGEILKGIKVGTSLSEILKVEPDNAFGSLDKEYLGYRERDFYFFFYDNEISVYTYSYKKNSEFENILNEYLKTKNLDRFVRDLSSNWKAYDLKEYDRENQNLHMLYSTRGVDINIKGNDPSGITFYNNYYITNYTKKIIRNGIVSFDPNNDLVEKIEKERRNKIN